MIAVLIALLVQPPPLDTAFEEMVVTARRPNTEPLDPPIRFFQRHCYDPLRRTREAAAPDPSDPDWHPADADVRETLGITNPASILVTRADHVRGHLMVLRIDRIARERGLTERRCTLTVIGGDSHARARTDMIALFRGPGTDRHVGAREGVPALVGWRQYAWTAMPATGSATWHNGGSGSRAAHSFLVVTDPAFYRTYDYVLGDLKVRDGDRPTSVMSLAVTSRRPLIPPG